MSRENVEVVRRGLELFNAGDIDRVLEILHPEIELTPGIGPMLGVATISGRDAVRRFWEQELPQALDEFRIEPFRFDDYGEKTLVEASYTAHAPGSGMDIRQNFATVYLIEDGLIRTMDDYTTRKAALEAAGLSE
jgi:ketosteroid isomerase-like protein